MIFMDILSKKLCHLGCNVVQKLNPFKPVFSIDFSKGTFIVVEIQKTKLTLEQMYPEHMNFIEIKNYFEKSQDIFGLIAFLATRQLCS